ncbi:MAG: chemotaxis protein CheW, partial [Telluria sp.]
MHPPTLAAPRQFLAFTLGGLEYGLDYAAVRELKLLGTLERYASAARIIGGVALSHGVIMPVLDLRAAFSDAAARAERAPRTDT